MGRILPVRSRGGVPPPFSQPPREPTFPAPTKVEFDSMSIRDLLAYVLPIMGYIVKDLYTPIVKDMDDWYGDPAKRSLWGKSVRYGMFDRSSETDILVHEVLRILLGQTRRHSDRADLDDFFYTLLGAPCAGRYVLLIDLYQVDPCHL